MAQKNCNWLAREVFDEINKVRTNPQSYIYHLEQMLGWFKGNILYKPGELGLQTEEGPEAVEQCINYLTNQKPVAPLQWDDNMTRACSDHANDIGPKGITEGTGSDGSTFTQRLERYGDWIGKIAEALCFGRENAVDIVLQLLVDDGLPNRGHRNNLLSGQYQKTGVACAPHRDYKMCTVIDYASEYTKKGGELPVTNTYDDVKRANKSQALNSSQACTYNTGVKVGTGSSTYNPTPIVNTTYNVTSSYTQQPPQQNQYQQQTYQSQAYSQNNQVPPSVQNSTVAQGANTDWSSLAQEVFLEINRARQNPQSYIPYLQEMTTQFQGNVLHRPGDVPLRTNEGVGAVQECISFLSSQRPLYGYEWDSNIARACQDHSNDIGPKGVCGNNGSDGSNMSIRLERYGEWSGKIGENIEFGSKSAVEIVASLLIDDGVANRGHRKNIMSEEFKKIGVGCALHTAYKTVTVINYAQYYNPKGQQQPQQQQQHSYTTQNQYQTTYNTSYSQPQQPQYGGYQEEQIKKNKNINMTSNTYNPQTNFTNTTTQSVSIDDPEIQAHLKKLGINQGDITGASYGKDAYDPDRPPGTIRTSTQKKINIVNGVKRITEIKTYTLADGSTSIVENTYDE